MNARTLLFLGFLLAGFTPTFAQTAPRSSTAAPTAQTDSLQACVGTYTFSAGSPISSYTITLKEGALYGDAGMGGSYKLLKQDKADQFKSTSSYGSIITFQRDPTTKIVTGLTLAAQGQEISATKSK